MSEEMREAVAALRKAAYEFGLSNDPADHDLMMQAQREIFAELDKMQAAQAIETAAYMRAAELVKKSKGIARDAGASTEELSRLLALEVALCALIPQDGRTQLEELLSKFADALLLEINGSYGTAPVSDGPLWHVIVKRAIRAIVRSVPPLCSETSGEGKK